MKIKKTQLKQIVKEELEKVLEAEHDAEPSMKDKYMEVVDNLYQRYGRFFEEKMEEDVGSALQGLSDTALAYAVSFVVLALPKPTTHTHDQAVNILQTIKAEGGINGLFKKALRAVESKGMK